MFGSSVPDLADLTVYGYKSLFGLDRKSEQPSTGSVLLKSEVCSTLTFVERTNALSRLSIKVASKPKKLEEDEDNAKEQSS